ncbi:MAG TPA: thioredoxin family protein [Woeseiaceae bacterium]|jgi:predicted thioredoxin/glutaredoxin|nr:thioredoxin family protein [Woeseiaceae bacterium]
MKVELFASRGCQRCESAKRSLQAVVDEMGDNRLTWRAVDILEEIDYAVALGVVSIPAIAIDGELAFTSLPEREALRRALEERLKSRRESPKP